MGMYSAQSDLDYYDELNGSPGRHLVQRTCANCKRSMLMDRREEYVMRPLCNECFVGACYRAEELAKVRTR